MDTPDSFLTIKNDADIELKIKGSRFIGQARGCDSENDALSILGDIRKKYYDATHNCFAYRIGQGRQSHYRYSDDGEPPGTAGRPIFDQIDGHNLTDLIVIVTRYFGGIKLGTGGLTHAYSDVARDAIAEAGIAEKFITEKLPMTLNFSDYNNVERVVYQIGGRIDSSDFSEKVRLTVDIRLSLLGQLKAKLVDITSGRIRFE